MTLRNGNDYLEFDGNLSLDFNTQLFGIINTSLKSYSFDVPATTRNKELLGILSPIDPDVFSSKTWILNNGFNDVEGKILVEELYDDNITISFFSGINNALALFDLKLSEIYSFDISSIFSYTGTEYTGQTLLYGNGGYLAPPVNTGNNTNLVHGDFQQDGIYNNLPCFYVKTILDELCKQIGAKINGNILSDFIYKNLLMSNDSLYVEYDDRYISDSTVYVGNTSAQSVTTGSTDKLNLVDNSGDFYDHKFLDLWNNTNHNYTAGFDRYELFQVEFSSNTAAITASEIYCQIYKNNVAQVTTQLPLPPDNITLKATAIFALSVAAGDIIDLRAYNNHGTTIQITTKLKIYPFNKQETNLGLIVGNTANLIPRLMFPDMSGSDFIKNTLSILNPVIQFNQQSKTLNVNLFKDIKHNTEVDWSSYIKTYKFTYYEDFINNFGKSSRLKYADSEEDQINSYNNKSKIGFGDGVLSVTNDFIEKDVDIFQSEFGASTHNYNDVLGASLPDFPFFSRTVDSKTVNVTNVTIAAAAACGSTVTFTTDENHNLKIGDWILFSNFASATRYNGFAKVGGVPSDTTFSIVMKSPTVPSTTGKVSRVTIDEQKLIHKLLIAVPNITVSDYFFNGLNFRCSNETTYCYAYFINTLPNGTGNKGLLNLCFDKPSVNGLDDSLSLKDVYWKEFSAVLNNPVVVVARMMLPEAEIFNLDISRPIRLRTEKFSGLFMLLSCKGYEDVNTECEVRFLKLS